MSWQGNGLFYELNVENITKEFEPSLNQATKFSYYDYFLLEKNGKKAVMVKSQSHEFHQRL
ncbi:hypothetical protein BpHYR1_002251 [Brachionus plicatilis]|uniref:Uncharacterized protein n=1 Tax=Brachionus plicatilis TaxID=10195 RepID=A0A3M7PGF3_BRAPC|nr:hypothetical protein BpHYR1_002251 [Brachionus plicatilis]